MKYLNRAVIMFGVMLMMSTTASAYLDLSVMTYGIQIVAGVVVAVGAVVGIYWRKMKKKVQNKLGIDKKKKKEVEEDVIEFKDETEKK